MKYNVFFLGNRNLVLACGSDTYKKGTKVVKVSLFANNFYCGLECRNENSFQRIAGFNFLSDEMVNFENLMPVISGALVSPTPSPSSPSPSPTLQSSPTVSPQDSPLATTSHVEDVATRSDWPSPQAKTSRDNELDTPSPGIATPSPGFTVSPLLLGAPKKRTHDSRHEDTPIRRLRRRRVVKNLRL